MMFSLEHSLKQYARSLGFELVGIAAAGPADQFDKFRAWLDEGYGGEMGYLVRNAEARRHPQSILPEVRSVVMVAMRYAHEFPAHCTSDQESPAQPQARGQDQVQGQGRVARYAWGIDYHLVLKARLKQLGGWLQKQASGLSRAVVDTAPLLERDFARRAGLGWIGKNTLLLDKYQGSYLVLGALLTQVQLTPDPAYAVEHCGTCRACLDSCPTDAFVAPYILDARRCISYLTIELRTAIPQGLAELLGDWIFGCDVCQEVCPWNSKPSVLNTHTSDLVLQPRPGLQTLALTTALRLTEKQFDHLLGNTALARTGRAGLARNAALVLGNTGGAEALPVLESALTDESEIVRQAARWAIERIQAREEKRRNPYPELPEVLEVDLFVEGSPPAGEG